MRTVPQTLHLPKAWLMSAPVQYACLARVNNHLHQLRALFKSIKTNPQKVSFKIAAIESAIDPAINLLSLSLKMNKSSSSFIHSALKLFRVTSNLPELKHTLEALKLLKGQLHKQLYQAAVAEKVSPNDLNDDQRMKIYDLLKSENYSKKSLDLVIAPIRKASYKLPPKAKGLATLLQRQNKLINLLQPHPAIRPSIKSWQTQPLQTVKAWISYYRTPALVVLNILVLATLINPLMQAFVIASQLTSTAILLGVVLWPVWLRLYHGAKHLLVQSLNAPLYQQAMESLSLTVSVHRLMVQLQAGVLDTPHYKISELSQSYQQIIDSHAKIVAAIEHQKGLRYLNISLQQQIQKLLHGQCSLLDQQMAFFCQHLCQRAYQDMAKVKLAKPQQIELLIGKKQRQQFKHFIIQFGSPKDLAVFKKAMSILPQFEDSLMANKLLASGLFPHPQPWGNQKPNTPNLKGWLSLFKFVGEDSGRLLAELLLGKISVPPHQFASLFKHFKNPEQAIAKAQQSILESLGYRPLAHVHLLSAPQQAQLLDWELEHRDKIQQAKTLIQGFLHKPSMPDDTHHLLDDVPALLSLLEGAKITYHLKGKSFTLKEDLLNYLDKADGSNPNAFYGARFFEGEQKKTFLIKLATKRLHWWLKHPNQIEFGLEDTQLFHLASLDEKQIIKEISPLKSCESASSILSETLAEHGLLKHKFVQQGTNLHLDDSTSHKKRGRHASL